MKKKMRKFQDGGMSSGLKKMAMYGGVDPVENELTSYRRRSPERKALGIGFQKGSPDYLRAVDALSTPEERSSRIRNLPADTVQGKYSNQAMEKVKSTAMTAGKNLMDMTPQGRVIKDVVSTARKYPRYSEGESSFEQEMGMKKGGMAKKKMMGGGMAMKHGGKAHSDIAKDKPMMKKVAAKAVKGHEKRLHGMAKGGGVEIKGKTKGKMIKMAKGGKAC